MTEEEELDSYLETALWSSTDEDEARTPMDRDYRVGDFTDGDRESARAELRMFMDRAEGMVLDGDTAHIGHDFWLTRNGHGAGFWDGDYANGDALTALCKEFGEVNVWANGKGGVYFD